MIVANRSGVRVQAKHDTERSTDYICPVCTAPVVLKKGEIKMPHFAHKTKTECENNGETSWHLSGKHTVGQMLEATGWDVDFEVPLGNRRADLYATKNGRVRIIEFQRKVQNSELYKRTRDLQRYGEVIWVYPLEGEEVGGDPCCIKMTATYDINALYSTKHPIGAKVMFFDDEYGDLCEGEKHPHKLYVKHSEFYNEYGEHQEFGGYYKTSKRWCEIHIKNIYELHNGQVVKNKL